MFYVDRFNDTVGIGNKDAVVAAKKAYDEALLKYMLDNKDKVFVINDGDAFHTHNGAACLAYKDMPMDTYECKKSYGRIVAWRDTDGGHRYPTFRMVHLHFTRREDWCNGGRLVPCVAVTMGEYDGYNLLGIAENEDFGGFVEDNSKLDKFVYDSLFVDMPELNGQHYIISSEGYRENSERPWMGNERNYIPKKRMTPVEQECKWKNIGWKPFAGED